MPLRKTSKPKKPRPANPGEAMELASLHQACLHLHYQAMGVYANDPKKHKQVSGILRAASTKLRRFHSQATVDCGDGYYDCNGMCIPDGQACGIGPHPK